MTGILRFVGVANAGVWLGGSVFYTVAIAPALVSADMTTALGQSNPAAVSYYAGNVGQMLLVRYFHLQLACATVGLLHLVVAWLYLGRTMHRFWTYLLVGLFWISVIGSFVLAPQLRETHRARHLLSATPAQREAAARSFRVWQSVHQGFNVLLVAGVAVYFWRAVQPSDELRFVGSPKIRG